MRGKYFSSCEPTEEGVRTHEYLKKEKKKKNHTAQNQRKWGLEFFNKKKKKEKEKERKREIESATNQKRKMIR